MKNYKTVSMREFQLRGAKYLKSNEPIILTSYNRPIAKVSPIVNMVNSDLAPTDNVSDTLSIGYGYTMHTPINQKSEIRNQKPVTNTSNIKQENILPPDSQITGEPSNTVVVPTIIGGLDVNQCKSIVTYCQEIFEKDKKQPCYSISYEDLNGTHIWTKWLCVSCLKTIADKVSRYGGKLNYGS